MEKKLTLTYDEFLVTDFGSFFNFTEKKREGDKIYLKPGGFSERFVDLILVTNANNIVIEALLLTDRNWLTKVDNKHFALDIIRGFIESFLPDDEYNEKESILGTIWNAKEKTENGKRSLHQPEYANIYSNDYVETIYTIDGEIEEVTYSFTDAQIVLTNIVLDTKEVLKIVIEIYT